MAGFQIICKDDLHLIRFSEFQSFMIRKTRKYKRINSIIFTENEKSLGRISSNGFISFKDYKACAKILFNLAHRFTSSYDEFTIFLGNSEILTVNIKAQKIKWPQNASGPKEFEDYFKFLCKARILR